MLVKGAPGCFSGIGVVVKLDRYPWSNHEDLCKNNQNKYNKIWTMWTYCEIYSVCFYRHFKIEQNCIKNQVLMNNCRMLQWINLIYTTMTIWHRCRIFWKVPTLTIHALSSPITEWYGALLWILSVTWVLIVTNVLLDRTTSNSPTTIGNWIPLMWYYQISYEIDSSLSCFVLQWLCYD